MSKSQTQKHISEIFLPLSNLTGIVPCGKNEAKIIFMENDKKLTSYIRKSKNSFIIQIPFKTHKFLENFMENVNDNYSHETSKQKIYRFETPEDLMENFEEIYKNSQN